MEAASVLAPEQQARACALELARRVLASTSFASASLGGHTTTDLIFLSDYILDGLACEGGDAE